MTGRTDAQDGSTLDRFDATVERMVRLQESKVLSLARRLQPGVTAEDIRNPHDFPQLDDRDFHFEDGMLAGLQSALMALRALRRETDAGTDPRDEGSRGA